jgi:DNA polymerase-3 subunit delta
MSAPVYLLKGEDDALLSAARLDLVRTLVGDGDASLLVAELAGEDYEMAALVDAAQTPPFLTDYRVVVGRDLKRFGKADLTPLLDYLADPLDSTRLVLEWGGRVPKEVADAVAKAGGEATSTGPGRKVGEWSDAQLVEAGLKLDREAKALVADWLGDEAGKLPALIEVLRSSFGAGTPLRAADVEPLLGVAGGVPPWDLTDAIDRGDIPKALSMLRRMLDAQRHPMQIMATISTHVTRLVRLDGARVAGEADAAALLGMKGSTFPAKKALAQARKLGHTKVSEAVDLVATAELQLRGTVDWPAELVLEVLVARLARLARAR